MIQALQEERKTMTRRLKGLENLNKDPDYWTLKASDNKVYNEYLFYPQNKQRESYSVKCPYGKVGDVLWVKEMYYAYGWWELDRLTKTGKDKWRFVDITKGFFEYRYHESAPNRLRKNSYRELGWYKRSSLFMPKSVCRIFLEITDIRVERLQDISQEDAKAEGVFPMPHRPDEECKPHAKATNHGDCFRCAFKFLWNKLNGEKGHGWNANDWVWVISFKQIDKPENF